MTGAVPSTSHCELGPCPVGDWERGRIAGCLGAWYDCGRLGREKLNKRSDLSKPKEPMDVSSRRLALVLHRHLSERGLLSFLRLLRAFQLNAIKRNQAYPQANQSRPFKKAAHGRLFESPWGHFFRWHPQVTCLLANQGRPYKIQPSAGFEKPPWGRFLLSSSLGRMSPGKPGPAL